MIIIGDQFVPFEQIENIDSIEDIKDTASNSTVCFEYDKPAMLYCFDNQVAYCVKITSIKEAVYANALGAKYILPARNILEQVQKTAENYLFDSKVLAVIEDESSIEELALKSIDGVIFQKLIK
jgi:hypothetical protein